MRDLGGNDCVRAASVWFLYDLEKEQPIRVTSADTDPYGEPEPRLDLGKAPRQDSGAGAPGSRWSRWWSPAIIWTPITT